MSDSVYQLLEDKIERLTRERDALRAAVLGLLEYWHEDDMDQEYYDIAEKQALAALEQTAPECLNHPTGRMVDDDGRQVCATCGRS